MPFVRIVVVPFDGQSLLWIWAVRRRLPEGGIVEVRPGQQRPKGRRRLHKERNVEVRPGQQGPKRTEKSIVVQ